MRIINKIALLFFVAGFLTACDKDVDLKPTDTVPSESTFTTVNDLNTGANGVYGTWLARRQTYISMLMSDEVKLGTGSEYRAVGAIPFRWESTSDAQDFRDDEQAGAWTNLYAVIDRANRVLFYMENVVPKDATETALRDRIKGEMLALRGFAHMELLRWYAPRYSADAPGVPYLDTYANDPSNFKPARQKYSEVITKVNADLATAKTLIPVSFTDIGRVTRNAVAAMQARVALYTNNYDAAIAAATEAIAVQPLTQSAGYAALWNTRSLASNQSTEVIWKLNISAANIAAAVGSLFQDANQAQQFAPSEKLLSTYNQLMDIRFKSFFLTTPRNLISKYGAIPSLPTTENFAYDIKMLRTSEMYLIRAEAYAEKNDLVNGALSLNTLRAARITGYIPVVYSSKDVLISDILTERYKELAYEGHRYFDLKRRNLPLERLPADVQNNSALIKLDPTNPKYLLPIPQQEIFANPNMVQNPGY